MKQQIRYFIPQSAGVIISCDSSKRGHLKQVLKQAWSWSRRGSKQYGHAWAGTQEIAGMEQERTTLTSSSFVMCLGLRDCMAVRKVVRNHLHRMWFLGILSLTTSTSVDHYIETMIPKISGFV
jgi:hypothetical protein